MTIAELEAKAKSEGDSFIKWFGIAVGYKRLRKYGRRIPVPVANSARQTKLRGMVALGFTSGKQLRKWRKRQTKERATAGHLFTLEAGR